MGNYFLDRQYTRRYVDTVEYLHYSAYSISIIELLSTQFMQLVFIGSQDYFEKPQTTVCPRSRDPLYAVSRYI